MNILNITSVPEPKIYHGFIFITYFPNGMIYVGQSTTRIKKHYFGSGAKICDYIRSKGTKGLRREILNFCNCQLTLDFFETFQVQRFKADDDKIGYNILPGTSNKFGSGSPMKIPSVAKRVTESLKKLYSSPEGDVIKLKISNKQKERFKRNPELLPIGNKNGMFNRKHSEHSKKLISDNNIERYEQNPSLKEKCSVNFVNFWKTMSNEDRKNFCFQRVEKLKKKIIGFDLDLENIFVFDSLIEAEKELGLHRTNISAVLRGKSSHCGFFIWRRFDDILLNKIINRKENNEKIKHSLFTNCGIKKIILLEEI